MTFSLIGLAMLFGLVAQTDVVQSDGLSKLFSIYSVYNL